MTITVQKNLSFSMAQVTKMLGISHGTIKKVVEDYDIKTEYSKRGNVEVRTYTPANIFEIQQRRRESGAIEGLPTLTNVCIYAKKGGISKTTIAINVAVACQLAGLRVLIVDNDPQGDFGRFFGYDPDRQLDELIEEGMTEENYIGGDISSLLGVNKQLTPDCSLEEVLKKPYGEFGPHIIPARQRLEEFAFDLERMMGYDFIYQRFIEANRTGKNPSIDLSKYDIILMDNNPYPGALARNSIVASDVLIAPVRFDEFSIDAVKRLAEWLSTIQSSIGHCPEVACVPTMFNRSRPRMNARLSKVEEIFGSSVLDNQIYYSEDYTKAMDEAVPIFFYKEANTNLSTNSMKAVCDELIERIRRVAQMKVE